MSCEKHFLGVRWTHHDWARRVTLTESFEEPRYDMWGRAVEDEQILCRTQHVCTVCGAVRDGGPCTCEPDRAAQCAIRLNWLAQQQAADSSRP